MSSDTRDPLEERDILKILDALDDSRVIEKIISQIDIYFLGMPGELNKDVRRIILNILDDMEIQKKLKEIISCPGFPTPGIG